MTTIDEKLADARHAARFSQNHESYEQALHRELASRGLKVVEVSEVSAVYDGLSTYKGLRAAWEQQGLTLMRYREALRDAIHQLSTRHGYIVTDDPDFAFAQSGPQALIVQAGKYWQDDTIEVVKRLEAALGDSHSTPDVV